LLAFSDRWVLVASRRVDGANAVLVLADQIPFKNSPPRRAAVFVVDEKDGTVAMTSGSPGSGALPTPPRTTLTANRGQEVASGINHTGESYGLAHVAGTDWRVYVGLNARPLMAPVRKLILTSFLVVLLIVIAVIALAWRFAGSIESPLSALQAAAERVHDQGYVGPVDIDGPSEITIVAGSFNRMMQKRSESEAALEVSRRQLQDLSDRLLEVQEAERQRIAREIHDELGQRLTALKMDVGGLIESNGTLTQGQKSMVRRIRKLLDGTLESIRRISAELRPAALDDFGLLTAIEADVRTFESRTGIECRLSLPDAPLTLSTDLETTIYRIVQEAMTNVARHSDATRLDIVLKVSPNEVDVVVRDDGRGITNEEMARPTAFGMIGMRERARRAGGAVEVSGGQGTKVTLRVPITTMRDA
jgi:signal transduction histidine kinase